MEIQCRCGAIRVELSGQPVGQFYCHCDDCQAVHGAAYVPVAVYPADAVKVIRGNPTRWKLKVIERVTCSECGTRIFNDGGIGMRGVNAYLLPHAMFKPAFHIQCQFALLPIKDDLPHFKSFPAAFGGSDEAVDW